MNKKLSNRALPVGLIVGVIVFTFAFVFAVTPGLAAQPAIHAQATVVPPVSVTAVIPNTGSNNTVVNNGPAGVSWIVWVIIGVAIIVLLIALLARGGGGTTNINQ
jgi:hypothetical protein